MAFITACIHFESMLFIFVGSARWRVRECARERAVLKLDAQPFFFVGSVRCEICFGTSKARAPSPHRVPRTRLSSIHVS